MSPPISPKPLPVHVTEPLIVAQHADLCGEYFRAWAADLKRRLKASEGGGGIEPSRHLQLCAGVADELRKACQRVERVTRGGVDAMNTSTLDATKNVVEDVLRYMYRVEADDPRKPLECCVCGAPPLDGINVCSKHAALARQTMFYLLGAANEAMGYTEDVTPGKRMRCDFPEGCPDHAVVMIDDDATGARYTRCATHGSPIVFGMAVDDSGDDDSPKGAPELSVCGRCDEPITPEKPLRAESDWWHAACYASHRAAKDAVPTAAYGVCPKCAARVRSVEGQVKIDLESADAQGIAPGVYHLACLDLTREAVPDAYAAPAPTPDQAPPAPPA